MKTPKLQHPAERYTPAEYRQAAKEWDADGLFEQAESARCAANKLIQRQKQYAYAMQQAGITYRQIAQVLNLSTAERARQIAIKGERDAKQEDIRAMVLEGLAKLSDQCQTEKTAAASSSVTTT